VYSGVIFDLDGTLIDTRNGIVESLEYTFKALGLFFQKKHLLMKFVGPPIEECFEIYFSFNQNDARRATELFRDYYQENALLKASPYPGILPVLKLMQKKGTLLGVATNKRQDHALIILQHFCLESFFQSVKGSSSNSGQRKDYILRSCIEDLGLVPGRCLLIGDTAQDAKAAYTLGTAFIGATWGFGEFSELESYPNLGLVNSTQELLELLQRIELV